VYKNHGLYASVWFLVHDHGAEAASVVIGVCGGYIIIRKGSRHSTPGLPQHVGLVSPI
jgi:hypothetical protein